jgi:hypothetical protein
MFRAGADVVPTLPLLAKEDPVAAFSAAEFTTKYAYEVVCL